MYSQKGTQRIEVIVRGEGVEGSGEMASGDARAKNGERGKKQWAERRRGRILQYNIMHSLSFMKELGLRYAHYSINGMGFKYGDKALQEQEERNMEVFEDYFGIATSVAGGAMMGRFGGPIGIVFGSVLGAMRSIMNVKFKYAERERAYNVKVFKQENAIEYKRARAGTNLTFGRLR